MLIVNDRQVGGKRRQLLEELLVLRERDVLVGSVVQQAVYLSKQAGGDKGAWLDLIKLCGEKLDQIREEQASLLLRIQDLK